MLERVIYLAYGNLTLELEVPRSFRHTPSVYILTMRMSMRRLTSLTNEFSKNFENHIHIGSILDVLQLRKTAQGLLIPILKHLQWQNQYSCLVGRRYNSFSGLSENFYALVFQGLFNSGTIGEIVSYDTITHTK